MISHSGPQAAKLTSYKYVISDIESNFGVAWNQAHWSEGQKKYKMNTTVLTK